MVEKIEYIQKNNSIILYRCYGEGSIVELPGEINGLPVTELADHCFAEEPSFRYKRHEIRTAYREQWETCRREEENNQSRMEEEEGLELQELSALAGSRIQELYLPEHLEVIGDYAFYGCIHLVRLSMPASLKRLGGGAFVACNHIRQLFFRIEREGETPYCMKDVLAELSYEVEAVLENREGEQKVRLTYPEYYEESKENTPARIIEIIFHGTGYKYRQCFQNRGLDFKQYDSLFHLAVAQEFFPTVMRLAFNRLQTPVGLTGEAGQQYLTWLRKEYRAAGEWIFSREGSSMDGSRGGDLWRLLGEYEFYTEEILEYFLEQASRGGEAEAVSYLMDYRRSHFAPKKKRKYEF